jgi:zinc finger protein
MTKEKQENKIAKAKFECPNCKKKADFQEMQHEIPYFGKLLISSLGCDHCKWKTTQVFSLNEDKKPVKFSVRIETIEDMETKVIRAGTATITIPEWDVEITPTTYTEGYYNNIEGLLELIAEAVSIIKTKSAEVVLKKIAQARAGDIIFTVILADPKGNSALLGKKVKKLK